MLWIYVSTLPIRKHTSLELGTESRHAGLRDLRELARRTCWRTSMAGDNRVKVSITMRTGSSVGQTVGRAQGRLPKPGGARWPAGSSQAAAGTLSPWPSYFLHQL